MKSTLRIMLLSLILVVSALADQSSPHSTVDGFYDWYLKAGYDYRKSFEQARPYFTDDLHGMLSEGFANQPGEGFWIDFDPFINAQVTAGKVSVGKPKTVAADLAMVPVTPISTRPVNAAGNFEMPVVKVYVRKVGEEWKIANLVFTGEHGFELRKWLTEGMAR